jgi:epoxide hydrolase-like predicted phosphatase
MIKAVIFDCFGVILTDALSVIVNEVRERDPEGAEDIHGLVHASNKGLIDSNESNQQIAQILGLDFKKYQQQIRDGELKDQRLLEYIRELKGMYKTAMLSNISESGIHKRFTDEELNTHFDAVVVSGEIGYAKPEPEAYEIVAQRLGVRLEECVFTDDKLEFCEAARGVGMQAIVYESLEQFKADLEKILPN